MSSLYNKSWSRLRLQNKQHIWRFGAARRFRRPYIWVKENRFPYSGWISLGDIHHECDRYTIERTGISDLQRYWLSNAQLPADRISPLSWKSKRSFNDGRNRSSTRRCQQHSRHVIGVPGQTYGGVMEARVGIELKHLMAKQIWFKQQPIIKLIISIRSAKWLDCVPSQCAGTRSRLKKMTTSRLESDMCLKDSLAQLRC